MSDTIMHCTPFGPRFEPAPLPDTSEPIPVTMTRKQWAALLDHVNASVDIATAKQEEIDVLVQLSCALIRAGGDRMSCAVLEHMLGREVVL